MTRSNFRALQRRLAASDALLEKLLVAHVDQSAHDTWQEEPTGELGLAVGPHKLPLGHSTNLHADALYPALGHACRSFEIREGSGEPLPRRRCRPKSPIGFAEPDPLPDSLWRVPPDTSIVWDPYTCKNYSCVVNRGRSKDYFDCKDCFDLVNGRERRRWLADNGGLNFGIDSVLKLKPRGTIRIGLDIGSGKGTFAARMRERGVTVVTSTMDFDGPFNNFVASRGLVPLHVSVAHRLPFYDGTLDVVHTMHVLSNWVPDAVLEFALFDIYRVLLPGGLFWLDHFFCVGSQLDSVYVPMLDRVGFRKLRWTTGRRLDRGIEMNQWNLSAVLEKPMT
uniref:Methyltransferase type 11 domain-containing protein n=1 Tax=Ananas comosus var. bracteatus TaxID=296719 RepID=A0A6V7Q1C6_ANACO|nr:unnamed protein product [Ananas comosus var. bracteatus]